jgi:hypothetical protein
VLTGIKKLAGSTYEGWNPMPHENFYRDLESHKNNMASSLVTQTFLYIA